MLCEALSRIPCVVDDKEVIVEEMVDPGIAALVACLKRWDTEASPCKHRCGLHSYAHYLLALLYATKAHRAVDDIRASSLTSARKHFETAEHFGASPVLTMSQCVVEATLSPDGSWISRNAARCLAECDAQFGMQASVLISALTCRNK